MNRIFVLILSCFVAACSNQPAAHAKSSAPVNIKYSVPKTIEVGAEVTTTIQFVAKINLQRLVVSALPYSGLELVSGGDRIEFTGLQRGDIREIEVNIRLADEVGYLSVFAATTDSRGNTLSKSIAVRYGTVGKAMIQKMRPRNLIEDSKGDKLILMPGDAR